MVDKTKVETKDAKSIVPGSCVITMKYLDSTGRECTETKTVSGQAECLPLGGRIVRINY